MAYGLFMSFIVLPFSIFSHHQEVFGYTSLSLASSVGHVKVVNILMASWSRKGRGPDKVVSSYHHSEITKNLFCGWAVAIDPQLIVVLYPSLSHDLYCFNHPFKVSSGAVWGRIVSCFGFFWWSQPTIFHHRLGWNETKDSRVRRLSDGARKIQPAVNGGLGSG